MKHKKNLFLCLIAILAIFAIVSCSGGPELPDDQQEEGLPLDTSENLDAWRRACAENPNPAKGTKINVQVTGTVLTRTEKNLYLGDDKDGVMFIYGPFEELTAKAGSKITLTATEIAKYNDAFQTYSNAVTINEVADGTAVAPTLITEKAVFDDLGKDLKLNYVTIYCRMTSNWSNYINTANILTKAEYDEILGSKEAFEEMPTVDAAKSINIHTKKAEFNAGDVCKLTGHMAYKGGAQLSVFVTDEIKRMPVQPVKASVDDWKAKANSSTEKFSLDTPMLIDGYVLDVYAKQGKKIPDTNPAKYKSGSMDIYVVSSETGAVMTCHQFGIKNDDLKTEKEKYKVGAPITMLVKDVAYYNEAAQVTNFEVKSHDTTTPELQKDAEAMLAMAKTHVKSFEEYSKLGRQGNTDYVVLELTVTKKNTDKNDKFTGYDGKFETGTETVTIRDKNASVEVGDTVHAYVRMGTFKDYDTNVISVSNYMPTTKKIEKATEPTT